ncbi:MAG: hypothetical protein EP318_16155 [Rhodobacteraceae bacterium]|nr:MAG: hypothetical protein EP318_16155 [Paracoccaceae bacterium]
MRLEVLNVSKYRTSARLGDDVPIVLPGAAFGICDGATDARGTVVDGIGAGRLAALTVAAAVTDLAMTPGGRALPGAALLARISERLARRTAPLGLAIPPSTTLAVVFDCGADWRFLAVGDTGMRINGHELLCLDKPVDDISTHARVAIFRTLADTGLAPDATEAAARRAILLGLDLAVEEGVLSRAVAQRIIDATVQATRFEAHRGIVEGFLRGGIKTQHRFGNDPESPLGFDTLNGRLPRRGELIDLTRPKSAVQSIEIFTDGYPQVPATVSVAAWEDAFAQAEAEDVHKIGRYATVKGSTAAEFFDDRTVIVLDGL